MQIEDFSRTKLNTRIEESILNFLHENGYKAGDQLPSQSWFAEALGISLSSLRETFSRLEERGILQIEHGKGTFLKRNVDQIEFHIDLNLSLTQMIIDQGMEAGTKDISVSMEKLPDRFQYLFHDSGEEEHLCLRRTRTADKKSIAYNIAYFEEGFIQYESALKNCFGSVFDFIMTNTDRPITSTDATVYAEKAGPFVAEKLDIKENSPLLVLQQIHKDGEGECLIVSIEYFYDVKVDVKIKQM